MPRTDALPFAVIEPEDVIRWDHAGATYALYRPEEDATFASDGLCTHEQVHLADGLLMGHLIKYPKHNGRFDIRDGAARHSPVCVALRTSLAKLDGGVIWVDLPG